MFGILFDELGAGQERSVDWNRDVVHWREGLEEQGGLLQLHDAMRLLLGGPKPVDVGPGGWRDKIPLEKE